MSFKVFLFCFFFLFFSSGGHLVHWSGTIFTILVKGHKGNICVNFFKSGSWPRRCHLNFFLFLALTAILFCEVEPF